MARDLRTNKENAQLREFGSNLRRERTTRQISQEKLSELVDLNIRTLQKVEAGETNLLMTTVIRIQKALRCPWDKLLPK